MIFDSYRVFLRHLNLKLQKPKRSLKAFNSSLEYK